MRARMLLPERKQCFKSLAEKFLSIQHIIQTWPQVISLVPKIEEIFGWQTLQKR
jgi:predicted O-linked N-acetylglucosamine transferase (SPINDLY family)